VLVGQAQQLLLDTGELVAAPDLERPSSRHTTSHVASLVARGDPVRGLSSARQATLAVAGSQTGSRDGYIEHERLFCKIVWGVKKRVRGVRKVERRLQGTSRQPVCPAQRGKLSAWYSSARRRPCQGHCPV
jgi:hypothetical protein